jgi:hypothetical protein
MRKQKTRIMTLQFDVEVPARVAESLVESAINQALDEGPCNWGDWTIGGVSIVNVKCSEREV